MSSHGKVLNLLDDRYLNLQDVVGNVEPFPTLVPYEEYAQNVLVYKMDTSHEIFMGMIQDFTDRTARQGGKELWTWAVQWEVRGPPATHQGRPAPASKKPRIDVPGSAASPSAQLSPRRPALTIVQRRYLNPELMKEEGVLRILIAIVQVGSHVLPNFIELLYRYIDFYEGDGHALQAALRQEIPSLWDFEYHPVLLRDQKGQEVEKHEEDLKMKEDKKSEANKNSDKSKDGVRKKPDLRAIEQQAEESERLQYKEVNFGLQMPKVEEEPMNPLINLPKDTRQRSRYYAACFKSRQRAINLLLEAGITMKQINNYKRLQNAHPKDTPEEGEGGDRKGLMHYLKEKSFAQDQYVSKEKRTMLQEKYRETLISNRLAMEARAAATEAAKASAGLGQAEDTPGRLSVPPPLIPPTPLYPRRMGLVAATNGTVSGQSASGRPEEIILTVPAPMFGRLKSKLFAFARPSWNRISTNEYDSEDSDDDEELYDSDEMEDVGEHPGYDEDEGPMDFTTSAAFAVPGSAAVPPAPLPQNAATPPNIAASIRDLSPVQAQRLFPLLNNAAQQIAFRGMMAQTAGPRAQAPPGFAGPTNLSIAPPHALPGMSGPAQGFLPQLPGSTNLGVQSQNAVLASGAAPALALPTIAVTPPSHTQAIQHGPFQSQPQGGSQWPPLHATGVTGVQHSSQLAMPTNSTRPVPSPLNLGSQFPVPAGSPDGPRYPVPYPPVGAPQPAMQAFPNVAQPTSPNTPFPPPQSPFVPPAGFPALTGIQRNPLSPLSALTNRMSLASPTAVVPQRVPIQIYFPAVVTGPVGPTDAIMLGFLHVGPWDSKIELTSAIFLPVSVWINCLRRVRTGHYSVLESYPASALKPKMPSGSVKGPHQAAYEKLAQAHNIMVDCQDREEELTKRWRATAGPMTEMGRGSVWEGWAAWIDKGIGLSGEERRGAVVMKMGPAGEEDVDRRREMDELMDELMDDGEDKEDMEM